MVDHQNVLYGCFFSGFWPKDLIAGFLSIILMSALLVKLVRGKLAEMALFTHFEFSSKCFKRHTLQSMSQPTNHWTIAALKDNSVSISELIVLMKLVSSSVAASSFNELLLRLMTSTCKVSMIEDKVSSMSGIVILWDT